MQKLRWGVFTGDTPVKKKGGWNHAEREADPQWNKQLRLKHILLELWS